MAVTQPAVTVTKPAVAVVAAPVQLPTVTPVSRTNGLDIHAFANVLYNHLHVAYC